ncbi:MULTISPECIES: DUF456 domain-containing protein [Myroides]|uniref:DUF456 family protein n=1 Tax=Myroides albus TaxID=2562892 RepID=A0A6I3LM98_9FLAO|nr:MULTISPECIES: DUF456 domain-containing protein [Myroides]MTG98994.1 DUF456 family protein [Myroides albus]MVX35772.1 DUF456 family protein [Myroides sp. LoEW2-1]UVD78254.1 DUF456 domain-containing protein [Myroides albus]
MEYFLLILSIALLLIGLIGSVLPGLPGLPLSWFGLLSLYFVEGVSVSGYLLWATAVITIAITILDYVIPSVGTKRFGGSSYGVWGTNIGLVVGLIAPIPFGFIIGPFLGAFIGEIIYKSDDLSRAFKAAVGSFIGFLASTFMKVFAGIVFFGLGVFIMIKNYAVWFGN